MMPDNPTNSISLISSQTNSGREVLKHKFWSAAFKGLLWPRTEDNQIHMISKYNVDRCEHLSKCDKSTQVLLELKILICAQCTMRPTTNLIMLWWSLDHEFWWEQLKFVTQCWWVKISRDRKGEETEGGMSRLFVFTRREPGAESISTLQSFFC